MLRYIHLRTKDEDFDKIKDINWIEEQAKQIEDNQIHHLKKEFQQQKKINILNNDMLDEFNSYLNNKSVSLNKDKDLSMSKLASCIIQNKLTKGYINAYENWTIFSKFEHYGELNYDFLRNNEDNDKTILQSLHYIMLGCQIILQTLKAMGVTKINNNDIGNVADIIIRSVDAKD